MSGEKWNGSNEEGTERRGRRYTSDNIVTQLISDNIVAHRTENWREGLYYYRETIRAFLVYWTSKVIFSVISSLYIKIDH